VEITRKDNILAMAASVAGSIIFGFTFVLSKQILNTGLSPYVMLSWRLTVATAAMAGLAACGILKVNFRGKRLLRLLPVGMAEPCLYYICEAYGIAHTTASESGTIIALIPIAVLIFGRLLFQERQAIGQLIGIFLSVIGVVCVVLAGGLSASFSPSGYALLFLGVIAASGYTIGVRWLGNEFNTAEITFATGLIGMLFYCLLAGVEGSIKGNLLAMWLLPLHQPQVLRNILLLALGASVGGYMLINYSIRLIGPTRQSTFAGLATITSIIFGLVVLGEHMLLWQLIGAAMIIIGVWAANYFVKPAPQSRLGGCE